MRGTPRVAWLVALMVLGAVPLIALFLVTRPAPSSVATPTAPLVVFARPTGVVLPMATIAPTATLAPSPTATAVPTATKTATPSPTAEPTAVPTAKPTQAPVRTEPASRGGSRTQPTAVPPTAAPTSVPPTPVPPPPPPPQPAVGSELAYSLDLINRARAAAGLPGLRLDPTISVAAQGHAADMAAHEYLGHVNKAGQQPWDRMRAAGAQFGWAAENLGRAWAGDGPAEGAITQMHDVMMAELPPDDGHRVNILSPKARRVGVGVARAGGWVYWVCDFAD